MAGDAFSIFTEKVRECFGNDLNKGGDIFVAKQREKMELRYYAIPETEAVLALLGEERLHRTGYLLPGEENPALSRLVLGIMKGEIESYGTVIIKRDLH